MLHRDQLESRHQARMQASRHDPRRGASPAGTARWRSLIERPQRAAIPDRSSRLQGAVCCPGRGCRAGVQTAPISGISWLTLSDEMSPCQATAARDRYAVDLQSGDVSGGRCRQKSHACTGRGAQRHWVQTHESEALTAATDASHSTIIQGERIVLSAA